MQSEEEIPKIESQLLTITISLLRQRPKNLTLKDIGLKINVSVSWLSSLLSDNPPSGAQVDRIEKLYNLLSEKPLFTNN